MLTRQSASATENADRRNASFAGSWVCDCDWQRILLDLARKDPVMKEVILQPHKTLRRCIEYVHEKAYETALKKAKKEGKAGVGQNTGIAIGSTEVFAWVIDYYLLDDRKDMEKKRRKKRIQ